MSELLSSLVDQLRWYGHVMRKNYEDWVKKCMEIRVEGRRYTEEDTHGYLQGSHETSIGVCLFHIDSSASKPPILIMADFQETQQKKLFKI